MDPAIKPLILLSSGQTYWCESDLHVFVLSPLLCVLLYFLYCCVGLCMVLLYVLHCHVHYCTYGTAASTAVLL